MKKEHLEHLIRAAGEITNEYEFIVIGSQSILGSVDVPPRVLCMSMEIDIYPLHNPKLSDLIDGTIGELSPFSETFGYYAQGVGPETAILPKGWEERLVRLQNQNTNLRVALCLELHDLAASKLVAGRQKDFVFVSEMLNAALITSNELLARIQTLPLSQDRKISLSSWVESKS